MSRSVFYLILPFGLLLAWSVDARTLETQLQNGLKIFIHEDHRAPVVVSQVWYKVGARDEQKGFTGLSHALEHMMFQGTKTTEAGEYSQRISELGGIENAFTAQYFTAYYARLGAEHLPEVLKLEADRMTGLNMDSTSFIRELDVVREERKLRIDSSVYSRFFEQYRARLFVDSSLKHPTIGWPEDIDQLTIELAADWYRRWYTPDNATLVIVGDIDLLETLGEIEKHFGLVKSRKDPMDVVVDPSTPQRGTDFEFRGKTQYPYIILSYPAPSLSQNTDDAYALYVLAAILDGGNSTRLTDRLVRGEEVAIGTGASYDPFVPSHSSFSLSANPAPGISLDQIQAKLEAEIAELQEFLVTDDELERVKVQVVANHIYNQDSMFNIATQAGTLISIDLDWRVTEQAVEEIQTVTPGDIRRVAKQYLKSSSAYIGRLIPQTENQ